MRSLLIVAERSPEAIVAALASGPDALLVGVDVLDELRGRSIEPRLYVRLAPLEAPGSLADLAAAVAARPAGVALPSCGGGMDVQRVSGRLTMQEAHADLPDGALRIIAFAAETPNAVLDLLTYRGASARLEALIASVAPLAAALGASQNTSGTALPVAARWARDLTLVAARAAGALALDAPFADADDLDGLRANAALGRADGFDGKAAIHPRQVAVINEIFG